MSKHNKENKENRQDEKVESQANAEPIKEKAEAENKPEYEAQFDIDALGVEESHTMLRELLEANDKFAKELAAARAESDKHKDCWYRTAAEFENFKKRNADLRKTAFDDGKSQAIKAILSIGDSLDRALSMELDEKSRNGIELVRRQFTETMAAMGVEEVDPTGKPFTPEEGEAIAMVDANDGEESGVVRSVFKKGYKLNGKTVRYAQVVVVK